MNRRIRKELSIIREAVVNIEDICREMDTEEPTAEEIDELIAEESTTTN